MVQGVTQGSPRLARRGPRCRELPWGISSPERRSWGARSSPGGVLPLLWAGRDPVSALSLHLASISSGKVLEAWADHAGVVAGARLALIGRVVRQRHLRRQSRAEGWEP
jgi:hypothetical protein